MTSAMAAYHGPKRMVPRDDNEFGAQLRKAIWMAFSRASGRGATGPTRDKIVMTALRNQHPKAFKTFPETALLAAARELDDGACSWCAYRQLASLAEEPPPRPSDGLRGLLGKPCARCEGAFAEAESAAFERRVLAAGGRPSTEPARQPVPSYYRPRRP